MSRELQPYWFAQHVRAAPLGAATVLLDLRRNRYFGVGSRETLAMRALVRNWRRPPDSSSGVTETMAPEEAVAIADKLVAAGLLSRDAPAQPYARADEAAYAVGLDGALRAIGYEAQASGSVRAEHIVRFAGACLWARRCLRGPLCAALDEAARLKSSAGASFDEARAIELVHVFRRLRPFGFAARDRCLLHALALVGFLSHYAVFPTWVIGVKDRPWAAHSWVQHGAVILDGNPEHICEYTPIVAV